MNEPAYTKLSKREPRIVNDDREDLKEYNKVLNTCCAGKDMSDEEYAARDQGVSVTHNMDECMKQIKEVNGE